MGKRLLATLTAIGLLGVTGGTAFADVETQDRIDRKQVQQALDQITASGQILGIQTRLTKERDRLQARSGVAVLDTKKPVPLDGRFRVGSVTKTFVSIVTLQLVAEGKVQLDAPVDRYLPGLIDKRITVRQILQHTSGLFNYTDALPLAPEEFEKIRYKSWKPEELVAIATSKPLDFEPGTKWSYSNTGYIVAGMLVEKVTGRPYEKAVEKRILEPLGLDNTYVPGDKPGIPGPHAHGYWIVDGKPNDITRLNPSVAWAAGEMISTTADLDRYVSALAKGRLLPKAQFEEMTKTTPASPFYGLGISVQQIPCPGAAPVTVWGHGGGIPGYITEMMTTPNTERRFILSATSAPFAGTSADPLQTLLEATFC